MLNKLFETEVSYQEKMESVFPDSYKKLMCQLAINYYFVSLTKSKMT